MASIFKRKSDQGLRDRPWYIAYSDDNGRRRTVKGCTDKDATKEMARRLEDDASLRRRGVRSPGEDRIAEEGRRPILVHVREYLTDCESEGQDRLHIANKRSQLQLLVTGTDAQRLSDLDPNAVSRHLHSVSRQGRSARTVNQHRMTAITFVNWCVDKKRLLSNLLAGKALKKMDEHQDRRRVRRAMSDEELAWLMNAAPKRQSLYLTTYWTGLRRSELKAITWSDIDLDGEALRVRHGVGKAKREDWISLRTEVVEVLRTIKPIGVTGKDRVFPTVPRIETFHRDCLRARTSWIDAASDPAERERREASEFLKRFDAEGRQLDLHGLRTTLGTHLAQNKVAPQVAQRIMRHSDMKVTLTHYTDLRLSDEAAALGTLPTIGTPKVEDEALAATGTEDQAATDSARSACAARTRPGMSSDGTDRQDANREVRTCRDAQLPYNSIVGNAWQQLATDGDADERDGGKSRKDGRLAQLARAHPLQG